LKKRDLAHVVSSGTARLRHGAISDLLFADWLLAMMNLPAAITGNEWMSMNPIGTWLATSHACMDPSEDSVYDGVFEFRDAADGFPIRLH
jgi:hypothetical protein